MTTFQKLILLTAMVACGASSASAQGVSASLSTSGATAGASAPSSSPADDGVGTDPNTLELGLYWGAFFADGNHQLYAKGQQNVRHRMENVAPDLGLRIGYFPWSLAGIEAELGLVPSQRHDNNVGVNIMTARAHLMLLAPTKTFVPFVLVGGGLLSMSSSPKAYGNDADGELHVGIGAKAYIKENVALRLDLRDTFHSGFGKNEFSQSPEVLLGFVVVAGRAEPPPPPPPPPPVVDTDGDGFDDTKDACKDKVGVAPDGCPPPDRDADGIIDADDACPDAAGPKNDDFTKNGCPPPADKDADGVPDASDKCPDVAGDAADGCIADGDGDGLRDRDDKCPAEPETKNGYEDADGCADELPEAIKKFTGVIEGIVFDPNKATIRKESFAKLDEAVKVLTEFTALRMEVSGHSDNSGDDAKNTTLSQERADAVKTYFTGKGIAAERVEAVGKGSSMPIVDNKTKEGRAKNRRIEFRVLQ